MNLPKFVCLHLFHLTLFQTMVFPEGIKHGNYWRKNQRSLLLFMVSENKTGDSSGYNANELKTPGPELRLVLVHPDFRQGPMLRGLKLLYHLPTGQRGEES